MRAPGAAVVGAGRRRGERGRHDAAAPHLRTCLVCRARLRDYRAAPAKVAALVPPAAVGSSLLASARELVGSVSGWISERRAALAVRWHQAAELAVAHKGAAVIASAAVIGGGGAATVATVAGDPDPARSAARAPAHTSRQPPFATSGIAAPAAPAVRDNREQRGATEQANRAPELSPPPGEFTPDSPPPTARQPRAPATAAPEPPDSSGGGEFSP